MRTAVFAVVLMMIGLMSVGCATAPETPQERAELLQNARVKLEMFAAARPSDYNAYSDSSVAVAVFPHVGEGAWIIGGSYGRGVLLMDGELVGYCDITGVSAGFQWGGQEFTQIIFFGDEGAMREFQRGDLAFDADASATAGSADASAEADYDGGVRVFQYDGDGAMLQLAIGGQQFSYQPKEYFAD